MGYLTPRNLARTPLRYGLPKVHKPNIPLRPTDFACDSPTGNISKFVAHVMQPLPKQLPASIRDTKHLLRLLESLPPLSKNSILVKQDVTQPPLTSTSLKRKGQSSRTTSSLKKNISL